MTPIVNNRFEEPEIKYSHVHRMPKFRRRQKQAEYRANFKTYDECQKDRRKTKHMYRAFGSKVDELPSKLFKLLSIIMFTSFAKGRRFQPIETHQRALAAAMGFIGCRAKRKVKGLLDQLIELGFVQVLREPRGPRAGLYLPITHHDQPPPATVAFNRKRPQRGKQGKTRKKFNNVPTAQPAGKNCGHSSKRPHGAANKENRGIKKDTTCSHSPNSATPKRGFEQYLPQDVADSLGYNSAPPAATEPDQEPATAAGLETAPAHREPAQDIPSPSRHPRAANEGAETPQQAVEAAPGSSEPPWTGDTTPPPLDAQDPSVAAAQATLDAARARQGIPAPASTAGPSIEEVQAKLMERRRCQDWRDRKAARRAAKMPADRLRSDYNVLTYDNEDGDENRRHLRRKGGGKPASLKALAQNVLADKAGQGGEFN